MGYTTSTVHGIEVPNSAEANDVPEDIGKVVTALEAGSLVKRLTGAQIAALTSPQKPAGLLVYNTTTSKLQVSNGSSFTNIDAAALLLAGGTMSGAIAMGSNKVTGLAKGTATGDAVARQQIQSGVTTSLGAGESATLTFSPAFGSTPNIVATPTTNIGTEGRWAVGSISTTGATITHLNGESLNISFQWIAVGN